MIILVFYFQEFLLDVLLNIVRCDIINRMKLYKHFVFPKPLSIAQHCKKILSFKKVSGVFQSHFYHFLNIYSFMQICLLSMRVSIDFTYAPGFFIWKYHHAMNLLST